jgi:signal transduction histidine kinase
MDRTEALKSLSAKAADDRLRGARSLARSGISEDLPVLKVALFNETNRWVKSALRKVISALQSETPVTPVQIGAEGEDERVVDQIYAEAVEETTLRLVHEIRSILGRLDVCASSEIQNYAQSRTKAEWKRLQELLGAIDKLSQAASAAVYNEFDFAGLLEEIIISENSGTDLAIECAGPKPLVILGSRSLVHLVVANAVRNAIEATTGMATREPIVVNWDTTDREYWIAILDRGPGLPPAMHNIYEIGATTKKGHLGMGLALAKQAALSLSGKIFLTPRDQGGTRFEFRWPHVSL